MIVNGRYQTDIDIADRALQYGDGCFTTIAFRNGCLEFLAQHIQRLQKACGILYLEFSKWKTLEAQINQSVSDKYDCVVKVIISRGAGGRGYSPQGCRQPKFIITHHEIPAHYQAWQLNGLALTVSPILLAKQPILAGIKHLNRLEQVLIKQHLGATEFPDALVFDTDGALVETSVGNVFWKSNDVWYTPDLSNSGVEGVIRNQVISLMKNNGLDVNIVQHSLPDLANLQEMFICNSLMKVVPVSHWCKENEDVKITIQSNEQTRLIQSWLNQINHTSVKSIETN
ncbi:aminodeoxychorismate lyase [Paraglaciecola sp.]|uniref:aminodeoxychorismate lyase n=1 Tax=Paraglaciecola sp. TaxID=1920173 RepID=UPI003EF34EF6